MKEQRRRKEGKIAEKEGSGERREERGREREREREAKHFSLPKLVLKRI